SWEVSTVSVKHFGWRGWIVHAGIIAIIACVVVGCASTNNGAGGNEGEPAETDGMRTVTDAFGETQIPTNPTRVVVLTTAALENALALGVKPIGAPYSISVNANFFKHLVSQTAGIENTGTVDQPNLETIAKLAPDLIIGQKTDHEAVYED